MDELSIAIPEELTATMQVVTTIINARRNDEGILIMGENMDHRGWVGGMSTIRLYLIEKIKGEYQIERELEAFSFDDIETATEFVERLPKMSALEYIKAMNSSPQEVPLLQ